MKTTLKTKDNHYVYKITNTKPTDERCFYYGVHSSFCLPQKDTKYMGSSKYLDEAIKEIGIENFEKEILSSWDTREEANTEEIRILTTEVKNRNCYNMAVPTSKHFSTLDNVHCINKITGESSMVKRHTYLNDENLVSFIDGKTLVCDTRDNLKKFVDKDDYKKFNYYISLTKDKVTVLDTRDNTTKSVSRDDYRAFDYYKSVVSGKVIVIDTRDNSQKMVTKFEYDNYNYFISPHSKRINIYNNKDELIYSVFGRFDTFCKSNNLPYDTLYYSARNKGKRLYIDSPKYVVTKLTNNGKIKFKGWYAIKL